jgi:hypothetical protein
MNARILVRGTLRTWDCTLLLVLGILFLIGVGVAVAFGQSLLAALLFLGACACALGGVLARRWRRTRRRWVEDQGDGFLVIDGAGERHFADDDVLSMALVHKQNYHQGLPKSVTRRFLVWVPSEGPLPEPIEMVNTLKQGAADPLHRLVGRVGDLLCERAEAELSAGQSVLGEGWELHGDDLTVRTGGEVKTCRIADLVALEVVDNALCGWRPGQDEAFIRVPRASANAYVLQRLLADRMPDHPTAAPPPEGGGLGRIIFERRARRGSFTAALVFAVLLLLIGVILAVAGIAGHAYEPLLWAFACVAGSAACVLGGLHVLRARFRCHEHGVYKAGLFGARTLRYADLASFTYTATRHFHNGAYTGTMFQLGFDPVAGQGGKSIRHSVMLPHADQELENLRDQVSRIIAARMANHLRGDAPVQWTRHLTFVREGIEYKPTGVFRRKEPVFVAFKEVYSYQIHQGTFFLWVRGEQKPVVREAMTQPNFFPGFYLLTTIVPLGGGQQPGT